MRILLVGMILSFLISSTAAYCQDAPDASTTDKIVNFPSKLFSKIQGKTADLDQQLTKQTDRYVQRMMKREERLRNKIYKIDSNAAKSLFANSGQQYSALAQKLRKDTGSRTIAISGEYQPYTDSLKNTLAFLQQNPQVLGSASNQMAAGPGNSAVSVANSPTSAASNALPTNIVPPAAGLASVNGLPSVNNIPSVGTLSSVNNLPSTSSLSPQLQAQLQSSVSQLQALQAKMQDADQIKAYIQQRKQQIGQYITQHANLQNLLGKEYQGMNQDLYYYSQQVRQYKEMLNNPDQLEQKALSLLNELPAFQAFMKNNSQLAGLFSLPGNYGSAQGVIGLQTKDQVGQMIQSQVASGGAGGAAALQSNLQSAESQLDSYKDKLSQLGPGSGDIDMPDFKPNDQKTKTLWNRLIYGVNMQTTRNNYLFPTVTDLGASIGYKLGHSNDCGIGGSLKIGWGNGIGHVAFSSQGVGLRSFVDIKLKGSFFITGGFEYNYTTPITSFQQIDRLSYWTQSGLIGVSKTIAAKGRVFKQTKLSVLWDMLSYQQVPKTQPFLFRIGYNF